jgi:hypothetical protein
MLRDERWTEIGKMQQKMVLERSEEFFAGIDGNFVVRIAETDDIVTGNDIAECTLIKVRWTNSRLSTESDEGIPKAGEEETTFLSPASLAMELHCMSLGAAGGDPDYKVNQDRIFDVCNLHDST